MNAVPVGMVADGVFRERRDYVAPAAAFEYARLFANHLESGVDAGRGEVARDAQGSVIGGWFEVVLGVEPEDDVHGRLRGKAGREDQQAENERAEHGAVIISRLRPAVGRASWRQVGVDCY